MLVHPDQMVVLANTFISNYISLKTRELRHEYLLQFYDDMYEHSALFRTLRRHSYSGFKYRTKSFKRFVVQKPEHDAKLDFAENITTVYFINDMHRQLMSDKFITELLVILRRNAKNPKLLANELVAHIDEKTSSNKRVQFQYIAQTKVFKRKFRRGYLSELNRSHISKNILNEFIVSNQHAKDNIYIKSLLIIPLINYTKKQTLTLSAYSHSRDEQQMLQIIEEDKLETLSGKLSSLYDSIAKKQQKYLTRAVYMTLNARIKVKVKHFVNNNTFSNTQYEQLIKSIEDYIKSTCVKLRNNKEISEIMIACFKQAFEETYGTPKMENSRSEYEHK